MSYLAMDFNVCIMNEIFFPHGHKQSCTQSNSNIFHKRCKREPCLL